MWTPLDTFADNVAHATGKFGLKITQYFPSVNGYNCGRSPGSSPTSKAPPLVSSPAVFQRFTSFSSNFFGVWGENVVDVHFEGLQILDHGVAAVEFMYWNGLHALFAKSEIRDSLFVGQTRPCRAAVTSAYDEMGDDNVLAHEKTEKRRSCANPTARPPSNDLPVDRLFSSR